MPKRIDCHAHIVGNGSQGSGCFIRQRGVYKRLLNRIMLSNFGLPGSALSGDLDQLYVDKLLEHIRSSSLDAAVILASDFVHDQRGSRLEEQTAFYVPNDYVLDLADRHPEFIAGVSIHPAREDALEELERCIARGARVMKCLPLYHRIDCNDSRFRRFWERMAEARMLLLAHTGGELSLPVYVKEFAAPEIVTLPLECGVTVIAAHAATSSTPWETDYLGRLRVMFNRYPRLFADNSALNSPYRAGHMPKLIAPEVAQRIVYGSDLPIPITSIGARIWRLMPGREISRCAAIPNPLERDLQLKRAAGFSADTEERLAGLLGV